MTCPRIVVVSTWDGYIDRSAGPDECWPWTGPLDAAGYGRSQVKDFGVWRSAGAHQIANYLATGTWERGAEGRLVRHLCHNRRCCNPRHLAGGTPHENSQDRLKREASTRASARAAHLASLSPVAVEVESGTPAARLIEQFGARALAKWSGRHISRVYAWTWPLSKGGPGGLVPLRVRQSIREGARAEGHEIHPNEFEPLPGEGYDLGEAA